MRTYLESHSKSLRSTSISPLVALVVMTVYQTCRAAHWEALWKDPRAFTFANGHLSCGALYIPLASKLLPEFVYTLLYSSYTDSCTQVPSNLRHSCIRLILFRPALPNVRYIPHDIDFVNRFIPSVAFLSAGKIPRSYAS